MEYWQVVGQQRFRVDGDTVYWDVSGDISGHELTTIFEECFRVQGTYGYTLCHINVAGEWSFPPEAREALAHFHRTHTAIGATAVVGISAKMAMFIDLVLRGVAKVSGKRHNTRFFRTAQEAAAWHGEERAQFRENLRAKEN